MIIKLTDYETGRPIYVPLHQLTPFFEAIDDSGKFMGTVIPTGPEESMVVKERAEEIEALYTVELLQTAGSIMDMFVRRTFLKS